MESEMRETTYGSVCSGIEAATVAWHPLGWSPRWFAEIDPFPCAALAHHWPDVPNLGDLTLIRDRIATGEVDAPDVLVGGTPCQAFSVAGMRESLNDARGQLTLEFVRLADAIDHARLDRGLPPCTIVWENVPGVVSTPDNAFGCFLAGLVGEGVPLEPPGGRWSNAGHVRGPQRAAAWRILDAQYFGVAQRRRRVFVVASAGDLRPEQVLLEFDGVRRDSPPRREAGKDFAHDVAPCLTSGGRGVERAGETRGQDPVVAIAKSFDSRNGLAANGSTELRDVANPLRATDYKDPQIAVCSTGFIFHTLRAEGHDASEDGAGRGVGAVAVAFSSKDYGSDAAEDLAPTMRSMGHNKSHANGGGQLAVAVALRGREGGATAEIGDGAAFTLRAPTGVDKPHALVGMQVRRLTPTECERLQGFPDGHTMVPTTMVRHRRKCDLHGTKEVVPAGTARLPCGCKAKHVAAKDCPDGPRYKALGNSMCTKVMRWIGVRIARQLEVLA